MIRTWRTRRSVIALVNSLQSIKVDQAFTCVPSASWAVVCGVTRAMGVAKNSSSIMSMDVGSGADKRGHRLLRWPRRSSCRITKVRFGCPIGLSKRRTLIPSRTTSAQLLMVAGVTRLKLSRARAAFAVCRIYSMRSARWLIH